MKVAAPWNIMATYCNYHHNYQGHRIKNKKGGWHCDQSLTSSYHLVRWMQIKGQVLFEDGEETPKKQTWHLLLYDFDSSCPSPTLLPPFPVNVSGKKKNNGGWHPDTSGLTRATPRPERSQARRRLNGKKIPPLPPQKNLQQPTQPASIQLICSYTIQQETAGMSVYYLWESNNVGVRFLSHSWACNKPSAFCFDYAAQKDDLSFETIKGL